MTLQVPRDPLSIHGAIAHMMERFGAKRLAAEVLVKPGSIYRWSGEDSDNLPNAAQVVKLDQFWCKETGEPPLLLAAMQRQIGEVRTGKREAATVAAVTQETLDVSSALGRLSDELRRCAVDGKLSEIERRALRAEAARVRKEIEDVLNLTKPAPKRR